MPVKKSIKPKEQKKETVKVAVKSKIKEEAKSKFIAHTTSLKVGDKAPSFKEKNQDGKLISLADFKGRNVILYFYPKDSTPGCTMEACSLRDDHALLTKKNFITLGVSADDEKSHLKFATKHELPFSLLADTEMNIIKAYDVWGTKQFMGKIYDGIIRTTFVISDKGVIKHIITDVKTKEHAKQLLALS
jgi:peroxiredoxin Q/BCP